jgi:hypothetical protein
MHPLRFKTNGLQRMIINPFNGFVGAGVNEPQNPLHVHANDKRSDYSQFQYEYVTPEPETKDGDIEPNICTGYIIGDNSYSALQITNCATGNKVDRGLLLSMENHIGYLRQLENANFNISMKNLNVMSITPQGNVGIETVPNATTKLHVNGGGLFNAPVAIGQASTNQDAVLYAYGALRPTFQLESPIARLQISIASGAWDYAVESMPGDIVFRKLGGGKHNLIFYMPNDDNDGTSAIKFGDTYNSLWVKIFNNRKMCVDGELIAKEISVKANVWSDFVFDTDYKLLSLSELEQFIKTNKHLPEIPTAKEVEENGFSIGEMQGKLLQKIEELTLYTIEQQKLIENLQKRLSELETKKGSE